MTDLVHLLMFVAAMGLLAVGLWWIAPAAALIGVGAILLGIVWSARNVKEMRNARDTDQGK